ncbi:MAG: GtrA family protein [Muribaculaceae bacterium]|nr:GtrA family protein [Muribaculaceae bacterium]MBQ3605179.1 GtrA family protein [Muribaculaceae bacterium]MBQ7854093.1 GtrA family protein [Muribaculaceae bacterium]MBR3830448.1 GtrA family protein [Muribaculaceae bacterium]
MNLKKLLPPQFRDKQEFKMLLKATATSQVSSWTDFIVSLILFEFTPLGPLYSKAIGATTGGIVNCFLNYKWTFRGNDVSKRAMIIKYAFVWVGSLLLNSYGTDFVHYLFVNWQWLIDLGFKDAGCFMAAQLLVSFVVSVFWNILLQRYFVFQDLDIKGFLFHHRSITKDNNKD